MRQILTILLFFSGFAIAGDFEEHFLDKTMRVDFYHAGTATEEHLSLDQIVSDGPWPGSKTYLVDDLEFGKYLCDVWTADGKKLLFRYGYATIYGEWETTGDAQKRWGVFHESVRIPWPKQPVLLKLHKRDDQNVFQPLWEQAIDPNARHINPTDRKATHNVLKILDSGPASEKVDLLLLGDGYTEDELGSYKSDAERLTNALFAEEPFKSRKSDFNVYLIATPSSESGVSRPHENIYKRSALGSHYSAFDSQRYVLNYNNKQMRDIASTVPYDTIVILLNEKTYGGGGIYRWQATAAAKNSVAEYLFVHEFGHSFAALADEYWTSSVSYQLSEKVTVEPWEANLTALVDPDNLKWKDLLTPDVPLPTPWAKEAYEKHSIAIQKERQALRQKQASEKEMDALFARQKAHDTKLLHNMEHSGKVGAFEGGGYRAKGYYRPQADCLMFTRNEVGFCKVCTRAINNVIDQYTK